MRTTLLRAIATAAVAAPLALFAPAMASASVVYNAIPDPLAPNYPSQPFQAQQTNEFGDYVHLGGTDRNLTTVGVTMSNWALASTPANQTFCAASISNCDGTGFFWPITVNVYSNHLGGNGVPDQLLATKTVTQHILWRPEADPTCPNGGTAWRAVDNNCYNGYASNITFDLSDLNVVLPDDVIVGFVYNTQTYGPQPTGVDGPYNSLNIAVPPNDPVTTGTDDSNSEVFWNTNTAGWYADGGAAGVGIFRKDTNWSPYGTVSMQINAITPPLPGAVHIFKFIDGVQATPANANNVSFPMFTATYNAPFSLNPNGWNPATPDQPYEASTNALSAGAQYTANEDLSTSLVGASCDGTHTYELVGYTTGSSLAAAQLAVPTTTVPTVTIDGDQYIIVWNHLCPPVPTIKVHIVKYLDNTLATAASSSNYQFPMTATWHTANLSGGATSTGNYVLGNFHGGATDQYGADTSPMQVLANYSTAEITNDIDNSSQVLPTSAQCASGKYRLLGYKTSNTSFADAAAQATTSSAEFFNLSSDRWVIVYNETCPTGPVPPPTNACATPGVAPQGWTLRNGTANKDVVVLASYTMFVGNGGNDVVSAGDGNYIVCTGSGNDVVKVGNGTSVIDTGAGNDTVKTGNGDMWVSTGDGNDVVSTGSGNDTIDLGSGNNSATTGAGNDTITAGSGNDAVAAGAGTDTCSLGGGNNAKASCEL